MLTGRVTGTVARIAADMAHTPMTTLLLLLFVWPPVSFALAVLVGRVIRFRDDWSL